MGMFLRIDFSKQMEADCKECDDMNEHGKTKNCEYCSCNGGALECLGEYMRINDYDNSQN